MPDNNNKSLRSSARSFLQLAVPSYFLDLNIILRMQLLDLNNVDAETSCLIEPAVFGRRISGLLNDVNYR